MGEENACNAKNRFCGRARGVNLAVHDHLNARCRLFAPAHRQASRSLPGLSAPACALNAWHRSGPAVIVTPQVVKKSGGFFEGVSALGNDDTDCTLLDLNMRQEKTLSKNSKSSEALGNRPSVSTLTRASVASSGRVQQGFSADDRDNAFAGFLACMLTVPPAPRWLVWAVHVIPRCVRYEKRLYPAGARDTAGWQRQSAGYQESDKRNDQQGTDGHGEDIADVRHAYRPAPSWQWRRPMVAQSVRLAVHSMTMTCQLPP